MSGAGLPNKPNIGWELPNARKETFGKLQGALLLLHAPGHKGSVPSLSENADLSKDRRAPDREDTAKARTEAHEWQTVPPPTIPQPRRHTTHVVSAFCIGVSSAIALHNERQTTGGCCVTEQAADDPARNIESQPAEKPPTSLRLANSAPPSKWLANLLRFSTIAKMRRRWASDATHRRHEVGRARQEAEPPLCPFETVVTRPVFPPRL